MLDVVQAEIDRLIAEDENLDAWDIELHSHKIGELHTCLEFLSLLKPEELNEPSTAKTVLKVHVAGVDIGTVEITPHHVYSNKG